LERRDVVGKESRPKIDRTTRIEEESELERRVGGGWE
jgi:hypothetical protein